MPHAMHLSSQGCRMGARLTRPALRRRPGMLSRAARAPMATAVSTAQSTEPHLQLRGKDNWGGLLPSIESDSINPDLRTLVVMYGELAQVTYDSFIGDVSSRRFGQNRFPDPSTLLPGCLLPYSKARRYSIPSSKQFYLYATEGAYKLSDNSKEGNPPADRIEDSQNKNWCGYIAVSEPEDGKRDVVIAFRGTITSGEWKTNLFGDKLVDWDSRRPELGKVHDGFRATYWESGENDVDSPRTTVREALEALLRKYGPEIRSVTVTGHSLGGALATLAAFDVGLRLSDTRETSIRKKLEREGVEVHKDIHVSAITFAAPRVGNPDFKQAMKKIGVPILRVVNVRDLVPKVPGLLSTFLTRALLSAGINTRAPGSAVAAVLSWLNWLVSKIPFVGSWSYEHTSPEWLLDSDTIMFVDPTPNNPKPDNHKRPLRTVKPNELAWRHNLEMYLQMASTMSAAGGGTLPRDLLLLNKMNSCLDPRWLMEYGFPDVPKNWHQPLASQFYTEWKDSTKQ